MSHKASSFDWKTYLKLSTGLLNFNNIEHVYAKVILETQNNFETQKNEGQSHS